MIAGLGLRPSCTVAEAVALVRRASPSVEALAIPWFREAQGREVAAALGIPAIVVHAAALAAVQDRCPTRSAAAERATGFASVAEAAALAASGPRARLTGHRIASQNATCAMATAA